MEGGGGGKMIEKVLVLPVSLRRQELRGEMGNHWESLGITAEITAACPLPPHSLLLALPSFPFTLQYCLSLCFSISSYSHRG